jgi:hypothetical protein
LSYNLLTGGANLDPYLVLSRDQSHQLRNGFRLCYSLQPWDARQACQHIIKFFLSRRNILSERIYLKQLLIRKEREQEAGYFQAVKSRALMSTVFSF